MMNYLFLIILTVRSLICKQTFQTWGPGLNPHIVMPARYFFMESLSNHSCSEEDIDVKITGSVGNRPCRIYTNTLSSKRCYHIARYKLYETCEKLIISVQDERDPVMYGPFYPDNCNCPRSNLETWLRDWKCGDIPQQVVDDLSIFSGIDFGIIRNKIITKYYNPGSISLCHYIVKNNKIYRKCYGKYVGFKMFMDSILLSLARKTVLPDLEFFVNLGDWPLVKEPINKFPVFSWCGSNHTYDIVMPTYDITESTLENMGRVTLDMLSVQGNVKNVWRKRIPKLFWRGRDSNRDRLHLIDIAHENPDLFNVSITNFFFFRAEETQYGPKSDHVSFFSFFDYKYQLGIDGTVAAYRLPYLLAGGSLVFKQDSQYYEHFYRKLIPGVHYMPVKRDLSDLVEKIRWAQNNDQKARKIAEAGQDFAKENLMPKDVFCYYGHLLNEFSKKVISSIDILEDMEVLENSNAIECMCIHNNTKDEL